MLSLYTTPTAPRTTAGGRPTSRRTLIKGAGLVGAAALLGAAPAQAQATLTLDVACDGGTFVLNRSAPARPNASPRRGDLFLVQGRIFPGGTIEQGLSGPSQPGSLGTWVCRGWFYYSLAEIMAGAAPHVVTTQHYLLDTADGLYSDGMEGGLYVLRAVIGGHGAYQGARGQVSQEELATNDTLLDLGDGVQAPAPNIRFIFTLAG